MAKAVMPLTAGVCQSVVLPMPVKVGVVAVMHLVAVDREPVAAAMDVDARALVGRRGQGGVAVDDRMLAEEDHLAWGARGRTQLGKVVHRWALEGASWA